MNAVVVVFYTCFAVGLVTERRFGPAYVFDYLTQEPFGFPTRSAALLFISMWKYSTLYVWWASDVGADMELVF